jgi:mono/diheme cytochrome c family protein
MSSFRPLTIAAMLLPLAMVAFHDSARNANAMEESQTAGDKKPAVEFARQIRPILSENCFTCHGPDDSQRKAKFRLDTKDGARKPLRDGSYAIVPGDAKNSVLLTRILSHEPDEQMPPAKTNKRVTSQQAELIKQWIKQGAAWSEHWAFVAPQRPALPPLKNNAWPHNVIDRFILARLEAEGLTPSVESDKVRLIRRLTFDLTGLPPTPAEVDAFLGDKNPDAYERVVDRLLASPHYGERMALDWLDAARYADTHGYHIDSGRDMTHWREWVIDAFNTNVPYDSFIVEQVAGDLLPGATLQQKIASGFNRNHMINFEGGAIPDEYLSAYIVDRVNTTATVFLGLTAGCAQCHDHKYDPISQKEFYQLYAFFNNMPEKGLDGSKGNALPLLKTPTKEQQRRLDEIIAGFAKIEKELSGPLPQVDAAQAEWETTKRDKVPQVVETILSIEPNKRSEAQREQLRTYYRQNVSPHLKAYAEQLANLRKERSDLEKLIPTTMVMQDMATPRDTFVLTRGEYNKKGAKVSAGVPAALPPLPKDAPANRLGLARWLVEPGHPLTARVAVNRCWQMFFGTGLVKTAEDFGAQGELPSHAELLDWLAVEFMTGAKSTSTAWDVKALVRLMVTSATYRQATIVRKDLLARDPENRLLARGPRQRLQAEFIRDQALAISGLLNPAIGGASVFPYQPAGLWQELASRGDSKNWSAQFYEQSKGKDLYRRTMYTFIKRTSPAPTLATFDAPDRELCIVRRSRTNTPLQALVLMNDPTYVEAARKLAERMMTEAKGVDQRIMQAFRLATGRQPGEKELGVLRTVFNKQMEVYRQNQKAALQLLAVGESPRNEQLPLADLAAYTIVASVILNLDETITKG